MIGCNIIIEFCFPAVQEKILLLYESLRTQGLLSSETVLEQEHKLPSSQSNNLIFISPGKNNGFGLRELINEINIKTNWIIFVPHKDENYFDLAIECGICNIIHMDRFNEYVMLGILKSFPKKVLDLESFFIPGDNFFNKSYSITGHVSMLKLVENTFADFLERIENPVKNTFIINCHELISNAIVYGVLGVTADIRDGENYKINYSDIKIPEDKEVKIRLLMNDDIYGISVRDFGGLLNANRILERIRRQSIVAGETIPQGIEDYTGRGLTILNHHGLLLFVLKPGEFTEVSLISRLSTTVRRKPISILTTEF